MRVSRASGKWTAELTDVGVHYLKHGDYPDRPQPPKAPPPRQQASKREPTARPTDPGPLEQRRPLGPLAPTEGQRLYLRLLAAGDRLEIDNSGLSQSARDLLAAGLAPDGKVVKSRRRGWHHQVLYIADDPRAVVKERPVAVPGRLTTTHPVARKYRDDIDHHEVSKPHLARAVRIVHAMATALDEASIELAMDARRAPDGQFRARFGSWEVPIRLSEKSAPGGDAQPHYNLRGARPLPGWQARRQKKFIPTGALTVQVGGAYSSHGRQQRFSDTRSHNLEDVLAGAVREVEMRFLERRQDNDEAERDDKEQEERWQRVLADAERRAAESFRADELLRRADAWRAWQTQLAYVDALADGAHELPEERRPAVEEWIEWSRRYLAATDPLREAASLPALPEPTREFLDPHIRGWAGPYRNFTH